MAIATGVNKRLAYKVEGTWGTAPGASGAQILRRVSSDLDLRKETYQSNEVRTDAQIGDFRHGVRRVEGTISGELSPGTYQDFMESLLRQAWQTAPTTGAITTVTAAATSPQYTRSGGSFLSDGFTVGMVVRWTGWTSPATANNTRNFLITTLTATQMTGIHLDGTAVAAKASGDSVTCAVVGKATWVPSTGHTDTSFSIEHWHSDVSQSELFTGCKPTAMDIGLPATGMATIATRFMGKDVTTGVAEYYTTPTAATSTGILAAVNGAIYAQGAAIALLTGLSLNINGNMDTGPVAGSNTLPDIFEGRVLVSGQMTAYFQDATLRDYFINETEVALVAALTTSSSATADVISIVLPRIKVGGAAKGDGEGAIVQTLPFQALLGTGASNYKATTIMIQDSQAS